MRGTFMDLTSMNVPLMAFQGRATLLVLAAY
jgi:hypothetical protein